MLQPAWLRCLRAILIVARQVEGRAGIRERRAASSADSRSADRSPTCSCDLRHHRVARRRAIQRQARRRSASAPRRRCRRGPTNALRADCLLCRQLSVACQPWVPKATAARPSSCQVARALAVAPTRCVPAGRRAVAHGCECVAQAASATAHAINVKDASMRRRQGLRKCRRCRVAFSR